MRRDDLEHEMMRIDIRRKGRCPRSVFLQQNLNRIRGANPFTRPVSARHRSGIAQ